MSTLTTEEQAKIAAYLATHTLPAGLGSEESACSIAAINLALTGELTDNIPACMSTVIGRWVIVVQDAMPAAMRNSVEWKRLLPLAAGTGRAAYDEQRRLALVLDWMWSGVLPYLQSIADKCGFGESWRTMCDERAYDAAAAADADAVYAAAVYAAADADAVARADAVAVAGYAAARAAAARAAAADARGGGGGGGAGYAAARAAARAAWAHFDPCAMLARLVAA